MQEKEDNMGKKRNHREEGERGIFYSTVLVSPKLYLLSSGKM
jgi:hypothetical protein